jgi:hypothetical protein
MRNDTGCLTVSDIASCFDRTPLPVKAHLSACPDCTIVLKIVRVAMQEETTPEEMLILNTIEHRGTRSLQA